MSSKTTAKYVLQSGVGSVGTFGMKSAASWIAFLANDDFQLGGIGTLVISHVCSRSKSGNVVVSSASHMALAPPHVLILLPRISSMALRISQHMPKPFMFSELTSVGRSISMIRAYRSNLTSSSCQMSFSRKCSWTWAFGAEARGFG